MIYGGGDHEKTKGNWNWKSFWKETVSNECIKCVNYVGCDKLRERERERLEERDE